MADVERRGYCYDGYFLEVFPEDGAEKEPLLRVLLCDSGNSDCRSLEYYILAKERRE